MCGVFGLVGTHPETGVTVPPKRMADALQLMSHRGPDRSRLTFFTKDGSSVTVSPDSDLSYLPSAQAVLGHQRLSIIDLSEDAGQPMPYGNHWLAYNGEIYNYRDLRAVLSERRYEFRSQSDTEVLVALYDCFGLDMIRRLNGMFAFALWDNERRKLVLARDRYGIKPLYYTRLSGGELAFASEVKSLLALPGVDKSLDYTALSEHLTFQNTFGEKTLLKAIKMLEPGHWMLFDSETGELTVRKYWEPVFNPVPDGELPDLVDAVRDTFEKAVTRQLVGDVPIGSFLSGGMDTGAITAVTTRTIPDLHTFTVGFDMDDLIGDERLFDERESARDLSRLLNTWHHEYVIDADAMASVLPKVVWHLDDFRAGISYQNYLASRMVKDDVTVVLSGVGGDELFAGYPWRYCLHENPEAPLEDLYYRAWVRLLSEEEKQTLLTANVRSQMAGFSSRDSFNRVFDACRADDPLNRMLCFDMKTFLHGLLIVEDRLSMAHSVESRVPFLDNDLVDLCLTLPAQTKLRGGESKWILKEALKDLLPSDVLTRRKQGFTPPDASLYRGSARPYISDLLLSKTALDRGLFEPAALKTLLEEHFSGQRNHRFLIWSLMCLEWWHRLLMDPSVPQRPDLPSI